MTENVLEPLFAFLAAARPFAEVSRLAVVSRNWRMVVHKALKTVPLLNLSGFAESVRDEDVRLALVRVTSENLKRVDLSGCHNISAGGMENILQYIETCSCVKEVVVTACSNETVLRAVATRARAALGAPLALDLFVLLRSMGEDGKRYSFSNLGSLQLSPPLLLFDPALAPRRNALFQAAAHGTGSDVAMLLSLSFAIGDEDESDEDASDEDASDEGDIRTYDVCKEDKNGNSPLLLACRSGNFEIAEILVCAGADVSAANYRGDTPLLAAVGAGKVELAEMLVSKGADVNVINGDGSSALHLAIPLGSAGSLEMFETLLKAGADVNVVRRDGASVLALAIVYGNARILNCRMMPKMIECAESAEVSYVRRLLLAFLDPNNIFRWLKDGRSPRELLGVLCALMASAATERPMQDRLSYVRAFINCHIDLLQDPTPLAPLTVTDVVEQLALQESDSVFDSNTDPQWNASIERGVVWVNKPPVQHACRWTIQAGGAVVSVAYSADGSRLARSEGNDVVVCDAVSGFEVHRLKGHSAGVKSVAFSADGTGIASSSEDRTVRLWDAVTGSCKCTLSGHSDYVHAITWSPDGTMLASGSDDKTIKLWNAHSGKVMSELSGHSQGVRSVAWSPDGTKIGSGSDDKTIKVWNAQTGQCASTLSVDSGAFGVRSISYSPTGDMIAAGCSNGKIHLVDTVRVAVKRSLNGHSDWVLSVAWSPDGAILASGSADKTFKVWNANTGESQSKLSGHSDAVRGVCFSPDGSKLVSCSDDRSVKIWNLITRECVSTWHSECVNDVTWSPDGKSLGSASDDKTVRIWEASTGKLKSTLNGHSDWVLSVAWSPDGERVASASSDESVKIWQTSTGTCRSTLSGHSGAVTQVEFAHDGATLVSGGGGTTRYWDVQSGETKEGEAGEEAKRGLEGSMFRFSQRSSREQKVGKFLITAEGDILRIFKSEGGVKDKEDKDTAPVAFFRAPAPISTVDTSGEHIAVGCQNGEVLQLRTAVLLTG